MPKGKKSPPKKISLNIRASMPDRQKRAQATAGSIRRVKESVISGLKKIDPRRDIIPGGAIAYAIRQRHVRRGEAISKGPLKNSPTRVPPGGYKTKSKSQKRKKKQ